MDNAELKQLKTIKWMLAGILACFITIASFSIIAVYYSTVVVEEMMSEDECSEEEVDFEDTVEELLDENKLDEAIALSLKQIEKHPNDSDGYWKVGIAHYLNGDWQACIEAMNKTSELRPTWKSRWTQPYAEACQLKLNQ